MSEDVLHEVTEKLLGHGLTVATAESCTGGLLAVLLTERPGSSAYFLGGVSAYANAAKVKLLGIPAELITAHGAVSEEVARAMAEQVRRLLAADFGVGITGIAGPGGQTRDKPVGTVWCGLATPTKTHALRLQLSGSRSDIRTNAAQLALRELLRYI